MNVERDILTTERDALVQEKLEIEEARRTLVAKLDTSMAEGSQSRVLLQTLTNALEVPESETQSITSVVLELKERLRAAEQIIQDRSADTSKDEAMAAMQSQHVMEISERDSAVRRAEDDVHQQTKKVHGMSKQIGDLEQELASLRAQLATAGELSSNPGNATPRSDGQRSATFAVPIPAQIAPPSASIDASLPPSMRHKRQVSLAMLKARMSGPPVSLGGRSRIAPSDTVAEEEEEAEGHWAHLGPTFESQISDDAVFWCSECHGDLITL